MSKVFIDTAVFARLADDQRPRQRDAAARLLSDGARTPVTNALVLGQLYSALVPRNVTGARGRALAQAGRAAVEAIRPLATIDVTPAQILLALDLVRERQLQLWDAVNWASAVASGCQEFASFDAPGLPLVLRGVRFVDPRSL